MHWADLFVNSYEWEGRDRDDIKGMKIGSALLLSPTLNLELAFDDKDKANILQNQFCSVFIKENQGDLPSLKSRTNTKIKDLLIVEEMV